MIDKEIDSYSELDDSIELYDKDMTCLIKYMIQTKELYFDHSLRNYIMNFMSFVQLETFNEALVLFFNHHFPDRKVKRVNSANIVRF